jgi:hypothetical protein
MAHRLFRGELLGEDFDFRLAPQPLNRCGGFEGMLVVV